MDANKDEAINCLKIALKFLNKARRLDPSIEIDEFLSLPLEAMNPNPSGTTKEKPPFNPLPTSPEQEQEQVRVAKRKRAEQERERVAKRQRAEQEQEQEQVAKRKKAEQVAVVREIKRKTDYYDILGLGKNSTAEDIHKAYRKLSLKVHPDKNGAPGAEDAFKKLSEAFQCLSNEESRRKYDLQTRSPAATNSVPRSTNSVPRSSRPFRSSEIVINLIFRPDASVLTMLHQPWRMKELMMVARAQAVWFKLTGSFRLKYEFGGRVIYLPKEDDLQADNELHFCMYRLALSQHPIVILAEFI